MRADDAEGYRNKSLHCFHSFAIQNRIDLSNIPDVHSSSCLPSPQHRASTLLPSHDDDVALQNHFARDFSRILVKNIPYFQHTFEEIVEWRTHHEYYEEMSAKSVGKIMRVYYHEFMM